MDAETNYALGSLQAYEKGKMVGVLPFVHNLLKGCKESRIFRPPNPWIMPILALCREIYSLDLLKMNLKFEIECLFQASPSRVHWLLAFSLSTVPIMTRFNIFFANLQSMLNDTYE